MSLLIHSFKIHLSFFNHVTCYDTCTCNVTVTGPLWGESTGDRWIPLTKASDARLCCIHWSATGQTVEQSWDAGDLIRHHIHYDVTVMFIGSRSKLKSTDLRLLSFHRKSCLVHYEKHWIFFLKQSTGHKNQSNAHLKGRVCYCNMRMLPW